MSRTVWDHGIFVSTYAGSVRATPELSRKRVQITRRDLDGTIPDLDAILTLSLEQWGSLCDACRDLGPDCEGPEL